MRQYCQVFFLAVLAASIYAPAITQSRSFFLIKITCISFDFPLAGAINTNAGGMLYLA